MSAPERAVIQLLYLYLYLDLDLYLYLYLYLDGDTVIAEWEAEFDDLATGRA